MARRLGLPIAVAMLAAISMLGAQGASGLGVFGAKQNDSGAFLSISQSGKVVVWETLATNLSPDDGDTLWDVYARDTDTGITQLVSRATGTGQKGNGNSRYPTVSADGRFVAFTSESTNLSPDDTTTRGDTYVRDLQTGTTILADRATGPTGVKGNGDGFDGMSLSADGRYVAWTTYSNNLDPADTDGSVTDVYVRDLQTDTTTLVDRATGSGGAKANTGSRNPEVSSDGRYVAFDSLATNLSVDDTDTTQDIYVRDLQANTTTLVSRAAGATGAKGNGASSAPSISADGRYVSFSSQATNLSPDDTNTTTDVYVRDLQANTTTLASRSSGVAGAKGNAGSFYDLDHNLSADGRYVSFISNATNLDPADTESFPDMYVRDLQANTTALASRADGATGAQANFAVQAPSLSADGRYAAFMSGSTNLVIDDTDTKGDLYVRDLQADRIYLESRGAPSYPRPKGATPLRAALVPAFKQCTAANRTHGAPLAYGACAPPVQASDYLTIGTPDANGALANAVSHVTYGSIADNTSTVPDEADVQISFKINDVRRKSDLSDYTGEVGIGSALRLTDKSNGPSGHEDGTMSDATQLFAIPCAATPTDSGVGSDCTGATTAEAFVPGLLTGGRRTIWELGQLNVYDGGADGDADTTGDNTLFMTQGVMVP